MNQRGIDFWVGKNRDQEELVPGLIVVFCGKVCFRSVKGVRREVRRRII